MLVYKAGSVIISAHIPATLKLVQQLNSISYTNYTTKIEIIIIFFPICQNPKIHRTWQILQIYLLGGKSVGHHGCDNFWGCLGIPLLYYCTIIIPLYQAMWLYKDVQYTIEISIFMQVRFNSMIHNLTCILSEPPRQIF